MGKALPYEEGAAIQERRFHIWQAKLGIDVIVCNGESGGGNLAAATTMKAQQSAAWAWHSVPCGIAYIAVGTDQ